MTENEKLWINFREVNKTVQHVSMVGLTLQITKHVTYEAVTKRVLTCCQLGRYEDQNVFVSGVL